MHSSTPGAKAPRLLQELRDDGLGLIDKPSDGVAALTRELMAMIAAQGNDESMTQVLAAIRQADQPVNNGWRVAAIDGLGDGIERAGIGKTVFTKDSAAPFKSPGLLLHL